MNTDYGVKYLTFIASITEYCSFVKGFTINTSYMFNSLIPKIRIFSLLNFTPIARIAWLFWVDCGFLINHKKLAETWWR